MQGITGLGIYGVLPYTVTVDTVMHTARFTRSLVTLNLATGELEVDQTESDADAKLSTFAIEFTIPGYPPAREVEGFFNRNSTQLMVAELRGAWENDVYLNGKFGESSEFFLSRLREFVQYVQDWSYAWRMADIDKLSLDASGVGAFSQETDTGWVGREEFVNRVARLWLEDGRVFSVADPLLYALYLISPDRRGGMGGPDDAKEWQRIVDSALLTWSSKVAASPDF